MSAATLEQRANTLRDDFVRRSRGRWVAVGGVVGVAVRLDGTERRDFLQEVIEADGRVDAT